MTSPIIIDNLAFAKKNERLEGVLTMLDCPRLAELIRSFEMDATHVNKDSITVSYQLQGSTDVMKQHYLNLKIQVNANLVCQRCLNKMPLDLAFEFNYLLAMLDESNTSINESDELDLQEPNAAMNVVELIEDEVLMAMPISPTHIEACVANAMQSGEKPNPFSVLKNLIKP